VQQRTSVIGESRDVFTKQLLGEKHISGRLSCVKILGVSGPLLPTPMGRGVTIPERRA